MKIKTTKKSSLAKNSARSNLLSNKPLQKTKYIVIGICQADSVILRRIIAISGLSLRLKQMNLIFWTSMVVILSLRMIGHDTC